jgi:hypothetical protein
VPGVEKVDYVDTFIAVADDCPAEAGTVPPATAKPSVAALSHALLAGRPYELTSAEVLFTVHADRAGIPADERPAARQAFFGRDQACLRASPLGKRYGWGLHADSAGRLALVGRESPEYAELAAGRVPGDGAPVTVVRAMRSSRAR